MTLQKFNQKDFQNNPKTHISKLNKLVDALGNNIDVNGDLTAPNALTDTVYSDYLVSGFAIGRGASAPTLKVFRGTAYQFAFAGTGPTEQGFFNIHLLHGLKLGTDLTFHIHWGHIIASPTGNVKWQIDYTLARGSGAGTFPATTSLSTTQAAPAQYVHQITADDDMTISNSIEMEPDSIILGRVYRDPSDAADTFANDAYLFQLDVHQQNAHVGTTERNRPFLSTGYS